jgi:hypothetical protein
MAGHAMIFWRELILYLTAKIGRGLKAMLGEPRMTRLGLVLADALPRAWRHQRRWGQMALWFECVPLAAELQRQRLEHLLAKPLPSTGSSKRRRQPPPLGQLDALPALCAVLRPLQAAGITPFLAYGTLLGAIREGDFLAHDLDLDLGILAEQADADRLRALLRHAPELRLSWECRLRPRASLVKLVHQSGISVDLVLFERQGDHFLTRILRHGYALPRRRQAFGLRPLIFRGLEVAVPDPPEAFLAEQYGDWQRPCANYHFVLSSQIAVPYDNPLARCYLYSALSDAWVQGQRDKLRSYLADAQRLGLLDETTTCLARHLEKLPPT